MRKVISCSISEAENEFITAQSLSASELLQGAIQQSMQNQRASESYVYYIEENVRGCPYREKSHKLFNK